MHVTLSYKLLTQRTVRVGFAVNFQPCAPENQIGLKLFAARRHHRAWPVHLDVWQVTNAFTCNTKDIQCTYIGLLILHFLLSKGDMGDMSSLFWPKS